MRETHSPGEVEGEPAVKIDTILVPTDFSEDAKRALETATDWAGTFGSRVVVLHAYSIDLPYTTPTFCVTVFLPENFYAEYRDHAMLQVEHLVEEAASKGVDVTGVAVERTAWLAILDQAEVLHADLIVMGTRGLTGIKHVAFGSTAERVVRRASCPVLTVKAD